MSVAKAFEKPSEIKELETAHLSRFALLAFISEAVILIAVGSNQHWMVHPKSPSADEARFIETEMVQLPKEVHSLVEQKPIAAPKAPEPLLSKVPQQGRAAKPNEKGLEEKNQTTAGTQLGPTHGPVAVFSPPPAIPSYLQNKDLRTSVVIDFFIAASGSVRPKLVGSSGSDELDAIALNSAQKWQFRPAEKNHQAIDSKVRLRILFEVH